MCEAKLFLDRQHLPLSLHQHHRVAILSHAYLHGPSTSHHRIHHKHIGPKQLARHYNDNAHCHRVHHNSTRRRPTCYHHARRSRNHQRPQQQREHLGRRAKTSHRRLFLPPALPGLGSSAVLAPARIRDHVGIRLCATRPLLFSRRTSSAVLLPAAAVRHLLPLHRRVRPRRRHHLRPVLDRHRAPCPRPRSAGGVVRRRAGMGLVGGQFPCREVALPAGVAEDERRGAG